MDREDKGQIPAPHQRRRSFRCRLAPVLLAAALQSCGGGGPAAPPTPFPDFTVAVSPGSLTAIEGSTSDAATVSVTALHGFTGSVAVAVSGLPAGATTNPASPLVVSASSPQQFTVATSEATPTGTVTLALHATSGSLAHDASVSLTTGPVIQTSQTGTVLYLQSHANGHTARIGLDTRWGGSIVEVSMDGTNFVNAHDTGREVQPATYDGAATYHLCAGCSGGYGWDPVLGGDYYNHGSPVLSQRVAPGSLYTQAIPLQWWPDNFGGGPSTAVPSDMMFEQTVSMAPGASTAFKVHIKLTHSGTDYHYNTGQEFPAVYVNSIYTTFAYYAGASPWTRGSLTKTTASVTPVPDVYAPELSAALVDTNDQGLTVFVPGSYPFWTSASFPQSGGSGPAGDATVYMRPMVTFAVAPGAVIEGDVYLIPGDADAARSVVYALNESLPTADISTPIATLDTPAAHGTIAGTNVAVSGWAIDNVAVATVSVYVDGVMTATVTPDIARPDVVAAYPHVATLNCGWSYTLDSTGLTNGSHSLAIHTIDTSNNEAILSPISVTVSN